MQTGNCPQNTTNGWLQIGNGELLFSPFIETVSLFLLAIEQTQTFLLRCKFSYTERKVRAMSGVWAYHK